MRSMRAASSRLWVAITRGHAGLAARASAAARTRAPRSADRDCRSARRRAAPSARWRRRGRSPRAAARRRKVAPAGDPSARRGRASLSSSLARASARAARQPEDELRQHDVLERRELRQEMVELIDEANLHAAHAGLLACRSACTQSTPLISTAPLLGRSSRPAICSSVDLPAPDGPSRATASPGKNEAEAASSTSMRRLPCV